MSKLVLSKEVERLVAQAIGYCKLIKSNPFFVEMAEGKLDDLKWTRQLLYFCDHFTRCLSLRAGLCEDDNFKNTFSDHAVEEGRHRKQLQAYMIKEGISIENLVPTPEVKRCADLCRRIAQYASPKVQVLFLNVLAEGMALAFYTPVVWFLKRIDKLHGPYWHIHKEVDEIHQMMGVDLIDHLTDDEITEIDALLLQGYRYFYEMIASMAGYCEQDRDTVKHGKPSQGRASSQDQA